MINTAINFVLLSILTFVGTCTVVGAANGKAFDGPGGLAFWGGVGQRLWNGVDVAAGRKAPSKDSLPELAKKNVESIKETIKMPDNSPAIAKDSEGMIDTRLAQCAIGSVDQANAKELSAEQVQELKAKSFSTLFEVQAIAGNPACVQGINWLYLIPGGSLTASQKGGKVEVKSTK